MNRLKELRKEAGINQTELASRLGIVQSTLSHWEQGKYDIDNESLVKLAEIFDCSIDYILGRDRTQEKANAGAGGESRSALKQRVINLIENGTDEDAEFVQLLYEKYINKLEEQ